MLICNLSNLNNPFDRKLSKQKAHHYQPFTVQVVYAYAYAPEVNTSIYNQVCGFYPLKTLGTTSTFLLKQLVILVLVLLLTYETQAPGTRSELTSNSPNVMRIRVMMVYPSF